MSIPRLFPHQNKLVALLVATGILVILYFTGIPGVNDNIDPVFHLLHNLYSAMWSNMWAPSFWTLSGFVISDIRHARRNSGVMENHTNALAELSGQIDVLHGKLTALLGGKDEQR